MRAKLFAVLGVTLLHLSSAQFLRLTTNYVGDLEAEMTVPQIIRRWKYPVETHHVTTRDGYNLALHRIPRGSNGNIRAKCLGSLYKRKAIFSLNRFINACRGVGRKRAAKARRLSTAWFALHELRLADESSM